MTDVVPNFFKFKVHFSELDITFLKIANDPEKDVEGVVADIFQDTDAIHYSIGKSIIVVQRMLGKSVQKLRDHGLDAEKIRPDSEDWKQLIYQIIKEKVRNAYAVTHMPEYYRYDQQEFLEFFEKHPVIQSEVLAYMGYRIQVVVFDGGWGFFLDTCYRLFTKKTLADWVSKDGDLQLNNKTVYDICPQSDCSKFLLNCPLSPLMASRKWNVEKIVKGNPFTYNLNGKTLVDFANDRCENNGYIVKGINRTDFLAVLDNGYTYPLERLKPLIEMKHLKFPERQELSTHIALSPEKKYFEIESHFARELSNLEIFGKRLTPALFVPKNRGTIDLPNIKFDGKVFGSVSDRLKHNTRKKRESFELFIHHHGITTKELKAILNFLFSKDVVETLLRGESVKTSKGFLSNKLGKKIVVKMVENIDAIKLNGNGCVLQIGYDEPIIRNLTNRGIPVQTMNPKDFRKKINNVVLGIGANGGLPNWELERAMTASYLGIHKDKKGNNFLYSAVLTEKSGRHTQIFTVEEKNGSVALKKLLSCFPPFDIILYSGITFSKKEINLLVKTSKPIYRITEPRATRIFDRFRDTHMPFDIAYFILDNNNGYIQTSSIIYRYYESKGVKHQTPQPIHVEGSNCESLMEDIAKLCRLHIGSALEITKFPSNIEFAKKANKKAKQGAFPKDPTHFIWCV